MIPARSRTVFAKRLARWQTNGIATRVPVQASRRIDILDSSNQPSYTGQRIAKTGSYWTVNDLHLYNIHLHEVQDPLTFFNVKHLPSPTVHPELLTGLEAQDRYHSTLIVYIDLLTRTPSIEKAPFLFILFGFEVLQYVAERRIARSGLVIPFWVCGEKRRAMADLYLEDTKTREVLLLVREHMWRRDPGDAKAQLVAAAVAAFRENNRRRVEAGREPLSEKVMPEIVMDGTIPTFVKIPVTETLSKHIGEGTYPPDRTDVMYCQPSNEGMKPLESRRLIFSCYEAFKPVIGI